MLNERQERIIMLLRDNKNWMNGKEISGFLNVSDRTIRSDIKYINRHNSTLIESNIRNGYRLNINSLASINDYLENVIPQTSFQRCNYIIRELMFKKNEMNLVFLMDKVFVSDYSIENDIKQLKKMMQDYPSLKIVRRKKYIYLEGNEQSKRMFYKDLH